ncbi:MAG: hypothetical protein ACYC1E_04150 [Propionibacteriaceae bacterium]
MSEISPPDRGVEGFISSLRECGIVAEREGAVVRFPVEAVGGARSGQLVPTAVSMNELTPWPTVPPHWVHFPAEITIVPTNTNEDECLPGWQRHSRDLQGWATEDHPGQAFVAHVRSILTRAA